MNHTDPTNPTVVRTLDELQSGDRLRAACHCATDAAKLLKRRCEDEARERDERKREALVEQFPYWMGLSPESDR